MTLAVRKGKLKRGEVRQSVLDIVDSGMANKQIEDFTVLKESLLDYLKESLKKNKNHERVKRLFSRKY